MCFPSGGHSRAGGPGSSDSFLWLLMVQRVGAPFFLGSTGVFSPFEGFFIFLSLFACKLHLAKSVSSNGTLGQTADFYWSPFPVKYHHWDNGIEVDFGLLCFGVFILSFAFLATPWQGDRAMPLCSLCSQPALLKLVNGFHVEFACGIALTCGEDSYLKTDVLSYLASTVARKLFV